MGGGGPWLQADRHTERLLVGAWVCGQGVKEVQGEVFRTGRGLCRGEISYCFRLVSYEIPELPQQRIWRAHQGHVENVFF